MEGWGQAMEKEDGIKYEHDEITCKKPENWNEMTLSEVMVHLCAVEITYNCFSSQHIIYFYFSSLLFLFFHFYLISPQQLNFLFFLHYFTPCEIFLFLLSS